LDTGTEAHTWGALHNGVMDWQVRPVAVEDADAIAAIYAPIVERTTISFEVAAPTARDFVRRIEALVPRYPWLVARDGDRVVGYAYAGPHRERASYRWSTDLSVYVDASARRRGVARTLYRSLLRILELQGFYRAFAGITLPNDASVELHRALGFERVGIYRDVGFKFGAWRDTAWYHRQIKEGAGPPHETIGFAALEPRLISEACDAAIASS